MNHSITFGLAVLAVILYVIGFSNSAIIVVLLAGTVELLFWVRLFKSRKM